MFWAGMEAQLWCFKGWCLLGWEPVFAGPVRNGLQKRTRHSNSRCLLSRPLRALPTCSPWLGRRHLDNPQGSVQDNAVPVPQTISSTRRLVWRVSPADDPIYPPRLRYKAKSMRHKVEFVLGFSFGSSASHYQNLFQSNWSRSDRLELVSKPPPSLSVQLENRCFVVIV